MKDIFPRISLACVLTLLAIDASAAYPLRPIQVIVPFAAGGPSDGVARTIGPALSRSIGQPVIVENRPGADGAIAAQVVRGAPPDGYTLLYGVSSLVALPFMKKTPPFDTLVDFTPITTIGRFEFCMLVTPALPVKSVAELVAYARQNPDKLNYASSNNSEYMAASQFMKAAGVRMTGVPYKGAAQAMPDLIAGRVQVNFGPVSAGLPYVKDGRLRMLATLLPERSAAAPDVPTLIEAGVGVQLSTWQGLFGPARTPQDAVERLSRELKVILQDPDVRLQLGKQALRPEAMTPEAFTATIREDQGMWRQFIRDNNIAPD